MDNNYCDITLLLDKSGSMYPLRMDTIAGINKFLAKQREVSGKCLVSLIQFNHGYHPVYLYKDVHTTTNLTNYDYLPEGLTALLDAVGRSITEAGARFAAMPEEQRPGKVIMVIITDGLENASNDWTIKEVKEAIERQTTVYKWEFVFLGSNIDAFKEADKLGIQGTHTMQMYATAASTNSMYDALTANTTNYRKGTNVTMAWSDEQRKEQDKTK